MAARGYWWWERRRSVVLDVGLAIVSALECGLQGVQFAETAVLPVPVGVLFGLIAGSMLLVRRRWPFAVVLVSIAITPAEMGYLMGLVGLYTLAASEVMRSKRQECGLAVEVSSATGTPMTLPRWEMSGSTPMSVPAASRAVRTLSGASGAKLSIQIRMNAWR